MATIKKLPDKIMLVLAKYYMSRNRANSFNAKKKYKELGYAITGCGTFSSNDDKAGPVFEKDAILDELREVAQKLNWGWSTIAGTFWLDHKLSSNSCVQFKVDEDNWLEGGKRTIEKTVIEQVRE